MHACLIYTSITGNTQAVMENINDALAQLDITPQLIHVRDLDFEMLSHYDYLIIGTYTFGNGDIPKEMMPLYHYLSQTDLTHVRSAIVGTGDRFYPYFCGAVDRFVAPMQQRTDLRVTLKVELYPEQKDRDKIPRLIASLTR
ncbi:flavodoxin I [Halolactibacillus halophilus]|uniref:Flavodoxin n=1 Tax=Halolactibacillus halophilus TaxID=306540 RepID=A0A1I5N463_9BACI|nr:flavodoxin domain-containing protein [Halolactibacillus halophilus]GEM01078.1 flavodoxin [Halolactibacillus halophilus]SFP16031.1 flavodoxin I [Halolactibacillus halophilus]